MIFCPTFKAVDDLEEGKGADEELCLLPDEEREITDADKERALADQQAADNEDQENEANEVEDQETTEQTIEENGKFHFASCFLYLYIDIIEFSQVKKSHWTIKPKKTNFLNHHKLERPVFHLHQISMKFVKSISSKHKRIHAWNAV